MIQERSWGRNKSSRLLAKILRKKKARNYIEKIQNSKGDMVYTTKEIGESFRKYYKDLYSVGKIRGQDGAHEKKIVEFLNKANLPKITENVKDNLESPITVEEINRALAESAPGKSPGPDGFTNFYYKKFKDILSTRLCEYMNGLGTDFEFSREALKAEITVIPKEGKNVTICSSYRPISVINTDVKLYARVLANRLKEWMSEWIHPDQVGFTPKREERDNGV